MSSVDTVPDVDIDSNGRFKYILIKLSNKQTKADKFIVRGYSSAEYHADILDGEEEKLSRCGFEFECVGGGRIFHQSDKKHILVYGYSQGFGRANHSVSVDLLKTKYPDYTVEFSNEGY